MPQRILIFSLAYYPNHVSGAEIAIKEITDRIPPGDISFSMVTHRFTEDVPRQERIGNIEVHRVGFGPHYVSKILFVPLAAMKAVALHRKDPFDGFWVMMTYMLFPLVLAKMLGLTGPYVLTLQDGDPYEKVFERLFIRPVAPLLDWGMRHAKVIQAISTYLATWPAKRGAAQEAMVIPNGASTESGKDYPQAELDALAASIDKKPGEVILLTIARLVHQKAIDTVIRALPLLPPRVRLVVVGDGPDKESLKALTRSLSLADRVKFVGQVERSETAKYRKISDIFVLPSRSEGQSISLASTMLAGMPIIATQVGGIADFLYDAKRNPGKPATGWAVDPDSPEQIAASVEDILAHPETARSVVGNALTLVKERFDWDVVVARMRAEVFARLG